MEEEEEARFRMAHEVVVQDAGVFMNVDALLENVATSTISGIIVSVIVIIVLKTFQPAVEETTLAVDVPSTPTW